MMVKTNIRDRVILELLYATGIRVSELVHIQISDIDLNYAFVKVLGKGIKNVLFLLESIVKVQSLTILNNLEVKCV